VLILWAQEGFGKVAQMATTGRLFWFFPFAFGLMIATAATTEEFFFRGVLQTRLTRWTGRAWVAIPLVALLFGLYHVPYAYLVLDWPSHGDLADAFRTGIVEGGIGGLAFGIVYARSRGNLVASILTHALYNSVGGLLWLKIWGIHA
jgi:membrane protease YdiL (CAAX protease family)